MNHESYFHWLTKETPTRWWHDSGDPDEIRFSLAHQACGITTNPVLVHKALSSKPEVWAQDLKTITKAMSPQDRAEARVKAVVLKAAQSMEAQYDQSHARWGYVCAQVSPSKIDDRETMLAMARRFHHWGRNITVKLPATAAGLDVLEECVAEGISTAATLSFTVPQVLATAERYRKGIQRALSAGKTPRPCFAVIMIGRIDDYLREIARDRKAHVSESDILQAGLAISKRAYEIYKAQNYEATLMIAAMRGIHHVLGMAGADLVLSVHPSYQPPLLADGVPREIAFDRPVPADVINRLKTIPDFVRAYEPDGMSVEDFLGFGATQKTLSQFNFMGWVATENL
jgi:transaldolase